MRLLLILNNFIRSLFKLVKCNKTHKSKKNSKPVVKSKYESKDISRLDINDIKVKVNDKQ